MMMTAIETMMPRPRSSDILRTRQPALRHAGSLGRCSGSSCLAWLLLAVCILVVSGGTSAMPATSVEGHEATAEDLGAMLDAGEGAVATLVAGEARLAVHTAVLAARSPVFSAMFAHEPLKSSSGDYVLSDVEGPELRKLVAFMYSGRAPRLPGMTPQLLEAATKYGVSGLREAFEHQVARQLTVDNVAAKAVLAVKHDYPTLRRAAVAFIRDHVFQVVATPGWAEAVHGYPGAVVEFMGLLGEATTETRDPAIVGTMATATMRPHDGRSSAAATTPSAHPHSPTLDDAATPCICTPATVDSEATTATHPHSDDSWTSTAATPPSAQPHTPTPDDAALSSLRSLSPEEKGRRLLQAAEDGAVQQLRELLAAGADVKARGLWGWTALHQAAWEGHVEAARCLLEGGAVVDARTDKHNTPLHWAAREGHVAVVRLLLAASADHSAREVDGWTPLHWAVLKGHAEVATALLEAGASRQARTDDGRTALDVARQYNKHQLVEILGEN